METKLWGSYKLLFLKSCNVEVCKYFESTVARTSADILGRYYTKMSEERVSLKM